MFQINLLIILVCNVFTKFTTHSLESESFSFTANQDYSIKINKDQTSDLALSKMFPTENMGNSKDKRKIRGRRRTVVGGIYSPLDRYPYIVSLQYALSAAGYKHTCGGVLIAKDVILSAAHCYKQSYGHLPKVIVGDHNLANSNDGGEQFNTRQLINHPEWDRRLLSNDIMLIQIYGVSTKNPIKLNGNSNFPVSRQELDIIGWGASRQDGKIFPDILKETKLDYITNEDCFNIVADAFKTLMCTKDLDGVLDEGICYGDSGGPLIAKGESGLPSDDTLIGIVSALLPPCASQHPDYYTRVSEYYDWIRPTVCSTSLAPPDYFQCTNIMDQNLPSVPPSTFISSTSLDKKTNKVPLTIVFRLDQYPNDMIWALYETSDKSRNGNHALYSQMDGYSFDLRNQFVVQHLYLEENKQFSLFFFDKYGDGSCCESGIGYMFLYWGKEEIGNFEETNVMIWSLGNSYTSSLVYQFNTTTPEHMTGINPLFYHEFITMELSFDAFPFQISWEITSPDGETIYVKKPTYTYRASALKTVSEIVHLPAFEPLLFRIKDNSLGNSTHGILSLKLFEGQPTENSKLYESFGSISEEIFLFKLTKLTDHPSFSPTLRPTEYPSFAPSETISNVPSQLPSNSPSLSPSVEPTHKPSTHRMVTTIITFSNGNNVPMDRPSSSVSPKPPPTKEEATVEEQLSTESISSSPEVVPNTIPQLQKDDPTSKSVRICLDMRYQMGITIAMMYILSTILTF